MALEPLHHPFSLRPNHTPLLRLLRKGRTPTRTSLATTGRSPPSPLPPPKMAEHWKSTPKYWCKHCATYVRDTKLERQNHEATAKHQGAVKRSLRDLHRGKEQEEREKERARREIERLNGVVERGSGSGSRPGPGPGGATAGAGAAWARPGRVVSEDERKRQAEQLASLGVSIPQEFRGDLAMVGEWTVTSTVLVEDRPKGEDLNPEARAKGVHKRERTDEEKDEEDAVKGLFKKQRRWGRAARTPAGEGSEDLDALLSGGLVVKKSEEEVDDVKKEEEQEETGEATTTTEEPERLDVKKEEEDAADLPPVKKEDVEHVEAPGDETPVVAFKKRKPKNIRQK